MITFFHWFKSSFTFHSKINSSQRFLYHQFQTSKILSHFIFKIGEFNNSDFSSLFPIYYLVETKVILQIQYIHFLHYLQYKKGQISLSFILVVNISNNFSTINWFNSLCYYELSCIVHILNQHLRTISIVRILLYDSYVTCRWT